MCLQLTFYLHGDTDIRHTSHGSPQSAFKYGKAAPAWVAVPIMKFARISTVVIARLSSKMSSRSFWIALAKIQKDLYNESIFSIFL